VAATNGFNGFTILILVAILITAVGCDKSEDTVVIGAVYPLTGPASYLGEGNAIGAELAVEKVNQEGGINGKNLVVVIEDSKSNAKDGVTAFNKLRDIHKVPAVFTTLSSVGLAIQPIAEENRVVMLAESSYPALPMGHQYTFRNFYTTKDATGIFLDFLEEQDIKKIGLIYANDDFGRSALEEIQKNVAEKEVEIVGAESFDPQGTDFKTELLKLMNGEPDIIYVAGFGNAVAIIYNQARELDIDPLAGFIICGQANVLQNAIKSTDGTYSIEPLIDVENPRYQELKEIYETRHPDRQLDQEVLVAFDAVNIMAEALRHGETGSEIKEYLLNREFHGVTGSIIFDNEGESKREMVLMRINNGACQTVED